MKSAAWMLAGLAIGGVMLGGCAEKKDAGTPVVDAPPAAAAPEQAETPRPEDLAKLPSADPGWPKAGEKPVATSTTPNGVQVEDYVVGQGMPVLPGALVTVHFAGKVKDGERFQSTWAAGQPETHPTKDFLPGMQEGLVGMRKGGKRRMIIPAAMGFGDKGVANDKDEVVIPAGSTLVFDVELVDVKLTIRDGSEPKP